MTMLELLEESPIIAAIKSWEGLEKSLKSECKVVFVLFGTICDIDQIVARIKDAGKVAIVHVDMIQGLSTKRVAVDFIAHNTRADGIISTKNTLVEHAKEMGLYAIQRTFVVDSIALDTLKKQIEMIPTGCSRDHAGGDAEDSQDHARVHRYSADRRGRCLTKRCDGGL